MNGKCLDNVVPGTGPRQQDYQHTARTFSNIQSRSRLSEPKLRRGVTNEAGSCHMTVKANHYSSSATETWQYTESGSCGGVDRCSKCPIYLPDVLGGDH